jgi:hypothetical protein
MLFQSYTLELIDVTADCKDGDSMCRQFAEIIDRTESKLGCIVIYYLTDSDGGSAKGRKNLGVMRPWLFVPPCWAHQVCFKAHSVQFGLRPCSFSFVWAITSRCTRMEP